MSRTARFVTIAGAALLLAVGVFAIVVQLQVPPTGHQTRLAQVLYLLNPVITSVLGGYLAVVRPRHPAGWLVLLIATAGAVDTLAKGIVAVHAGSPEGLQSWAAWLDNWTWVFLFGGIAFLILVSPTGRLPSARWRPVARAMGVTVLGQAMVCALVRKSVESGDVVGMAQIHWLLWATAIVLVTLVVGLGVDAVTPDTSLLAAAWDVLSQIGFYGFPLSIGVAVSRHGLFEIDRVVSRTLSYVLVTGLLLGAYIGIIAGLSAFLPSNVNSLVVAAATLAVAALFVPVRRAVQQRVDHRFNRSRYNRAVLVERFADSLRRDLTHGSDGAELLAVVDRALEPEHAGLWLVRP